MSVNPRAVALQGVGFGALAVASLGFLLDQPAPTGPLFANAQVLQEAYARARGAALAATSVEELLASMEALDALASIEAQSISAVTTVNDTFASASVFFDIATIDD